MSRVVIRLEIHSDGADEPTVVDIAPRTALAWEKAHSNRSTAQLDNDAIRLEYLYEIAWIALGKPGGDYQKFTQTTDVWRAPDPDEQEDDESTVDPTSPEASTTTS